MEATKFEVIELDGQKYAMEPLTAYHMERVCARIVEVRKSKPSPLAIVCDFIKANPGLPDGIQEKLLTAGYHDAVRPDIVRPDQIHDFMNSEEGTIYCFWLSLRRQHPEIDLDSELLKNMRRSKQDELLTAIRQKLDAASAPKPAQAGAA